MLLLSASFNQVVEKFEYNSADMEWARQNANGKDSLFSMAMGIE
jgi:hypothetical protein